jgi:hypothetical protein
MGAIDPNEFMAHRHNRFLEFLRIQGFDIQETRDESADAQWDGGGVLTNGTRGPDEALGGPNERHWGSRRTRTTAKTRQNTPGPHQEDQDTLKHP